MDEPQTQTLPAAPPGAGPATRIPPRLGEDGQPAYLDPPSGGRWLREADGGLVPADADTAAGAGLAWVLVDPPAGLPAEPV